MNINDMPEKLIEEEQRILDILISELDKSIDELNVREQAYIAEAKEADIRLNPDVYIAKVLARRNLRDNKENRDKLLKGRDELYQWRLLLNIKDDSGREDVEEIKVGLHECYHNSERYIVSWTMPVCRHFILDNASPEFDGIVTGKYGQEYKTHFELLLKNKIDLRFTHVKKAINLYPGALSLDFLKSLKGKGFFSEEYLKELIDSYSYNETDFEKAKNIISDEFLNELLERRPNPEFQNIVFSIQKKQGEIIQIPYDKSIVVQGCAGSGKSMIMLHRLPVVLYDNPNSLKRNNLYIITPSPMYIQMVENMRADLEISDILMGTSEDYYNHCIGKYLSFKGKPAKNDEILKLEVKKERYIFSEKCVEDIRKYLEKMCSFDYTKLSEAYEILKLKPLREREYSAVYSKLVNDAIIHLQYIIDANNNILKQYYSCIKTVLVNLNNIGKKYYNLHDNIIREIKKKITAENISIENIDRGIKKLDPVENKKAIENRRTLIDSSKKTIERLNSNIIHVNKDKPYFKKIDRLYKKTEAISKSYVTMMSEFSSGSVENTYASIKKISSLIKNVTDFYNECLGVEERYSSFYSSFKKDLNGLMSDLKSLEKFGAPYLEFKYYVRLKKYRDNFKEFQDIAVQDTYYTIIKKIFKDISEKELTKQPLCPYLLLQILYQFYGIPNNTLESLITIDEAQGMAPEEIRLIKNVNGGKVVLNMFGDTKQHIEGTKGIDDWKEFKNILKFSIYKINENYRNAKQITDYCNKIFNMNMTAINTPGRGVHEICSKDSFNETMKEMLTGISTEGNSAIIVENSLEADALLYAFKDYENKFNDMTKGFIRLHPTRWNIILINDAKGLEFRRVMSLVGRMTENEKYISYTRALDELWVCSYKIKLMDSNMAKIAQTETKKPDSDTVTDVDNLNKKKNERIPETGQEKKIPVNQNSQVKAFFIQKGLEVVDNREENGRLWVVGSKEVLLKYVNEAVIKFSISGRYTCSGEIGNREGWVTKTNK